MEKTIIKSALITLAVIIGLFVCVNAGFALFAPAKLADVYFNAGCEKVALWLNESDYNRNGTNEKLVTVVNRSIAAQKEQKTLEYGKMLIDKYNANDIELDQDYIYFIGGEYCTILAKTGNEQDALTVAAELSVKYGQSNPVQALIYYAIQSENNQLLEQIRDLLNDMLTSSSVTAEGMVRLTTDVANLNKLLNG